MEKKITLLQAYKAMFRFLEDLYFREGQPDNLGGFLGGLRIIKDKGIVDPAAWEDWLDTVDEVLKEENK